MPPSLPKQALLPARSARDKRNGSSATTAGGASTAARETTVPKVSDGQPPMADGSASHAHRRAIPMLRDAALTPMERLSRLAPAAVHTPVFLMGLGANITY